MDTRNTKLLAGASELQRSLFRLEALTADQALPVTAYLIKIQSATFLEILVNTGLESSELEKCLEALCDAGVIKPVDSIFENRYLLDHDKLRKLSILAGKLARW
jgi:hypothetical protein